MHVSIKFRTALVLVFRYARRKVSEQASAAAFIIIYLLAFQIIILRSPHVLSLRIACGIGLVIIGLSFFSEGLSLGLMPLGEAVGLKLPQKSRRYQMLLFGLLVGFVSTLAEPAVNTLRTSGGGVKAWESPLLYAMLEVYPGALISAVGIGVAVAVALSLYRYTAGISLVPFVSVTVPLLIGLTILYSLHDSLSTIIGLAWDTGAVTTGPVTVPLVLALSIGVSRASGRGGGTSEGFGSIALASLYPVLAVMILAFGLNLVIPGPVDEQTFFSPDFRSEALQVFSSEKQLETYAFNEGSFAGRRALYQDEEEYRVAATRFGRPAASGSESFRQVSVSRVINEESTLALRAILPLTVLLAFVLVFILKEKPRYADEFLLGVVFTLIGMAALTVGIRFGLVPLGDTVGKQLPRVYQSEQVEQVHTIRHFDPDLVETAIDAAGERHPYFALSDKEGNIRTMPFDPAAYDPETGSYTHVESTPFLFAESVSLLSMLFVLLFAFGLGYGSTLAEPALGALGANIEKITVGTVTRRGVVRAVSVGVGTGLTVGVLRIMYEFPMVWILAPAYLILLLITLVGSSDFIGIAWDSGGVTTGPITVPLVLAMGLGIGGAVGRSDGFGILALASVFPIISVQLYGMVITFNQKRRLAIIDEEAEYER